MSESVKEGSEAGDSASETSMKSEENGPPPAPIPRASTPQNFKNPVTFRECFRAFSKFGDTKSDGKFVTLSQSDKWMKQAKIIDGKKVTTTDSGIFFKKFKQQKLNITDYEKFLADLCSSKKLNIEEVKRQMGACGAPVVTSSSSSNKVPNAFERLTDTSKYTGSHKQRFDESGKGKGIEGRKDLRDSSGDELILANDDESNELCGEALLQHIIRDPPCRLSFPKGCTFVVVESPAVKEAIDEEKTENKTLYSIDIKVDVREESDKIEDHDDSGEEDEGGDNFSDYDEALEYDNDEDDEEYIHESVEEEEDWSNLERDSDDYYSS